MAHLYLLGSGSWLHHSSRGDTVVLRGYPFPDGERTFNLEDQADAGWLAELLSAARRFSLPAAQSYLADHGFPIKITEDSWPEARQRLTALPEPPGVPTIPWTPLRKFYLSLREDCRLADHQTHVENILAKHGEAPQIEDLFERSSEQMQAYRNFRDTLWPLRRSWPSSDDATFTANRLVSLLNPSNPTLNHVQHLPPHEDLAFIPVGREVAPLRTRNADYDSGKTGRSSGHGGMDLLLRSADREKLPIVAEIKQSGDANLFLALVQSLTYAVELTTHHQFERLKLRHKNHFGDLTLGVEPRCDIYLIFLGAKPHHLHDQAVTIADRLLAGPTLPVARRVRRIAFIHAEPVGETLRFDARHIACVPKA